MADDLEPVRPHADLFAGGLGLILYFAERLVRGAVGTSVGFGLSLFLMSVVFIGLDQENPAVGAIGALEGVAGIARVPLSARRWSLLPSPLGSPRSSSP